MRFVKYMLAFLCLLFPSVAYAEVITLEAALKSAEVNNTDIAIARINLETAIRNSSVYSSYIPDISIDGSLSLDDMSAFGGSWGNLGGNLSLSISLDLGTDLITENALEKLERENAAIEYMLTASSLEEAVISAYWNLSLSQNAVETATMAEEDSLEALASAEERFNAGQIDELELQETRLSVLQYSYERQLYRDQLDLAYTAFSELTGIENRNFETEEIPEIPELSFPDAHDLLEFSIGKNLTIQSLDKNLEIAHAETSDTRMTNQIPSVTLSGSYVLGSGEKVTEWSGLEKDRGSVSLSFSIPISSYIPGSSGYLAVKESEDAEKIAALELRAGTDELLYSLEEDISNIEQSTRAINMAEETKAAAERAYQLKKERYESGYESVDELSDALRDLMTAELELLENRIDQLLGLYSLSFDMGISLEETINEFSVEEQQ